MPPLDDLLDYIFANSQPTTLYPEFEGWVRGSRRFRAFATHYRDKVRAKLKNARDEGSLDDLRAELAVAVSLLGEERFAVEYEQYAAAKQRGPDFTVTFKTHTLFNVEVRRIRGTELENVEVQHIRDTELENDAAGAPTGKLIAILCDKVGQMPPSTVNLLWLVAGREVSTADLTQAMITLRGLAERKIEDFFTRRGFRNASHFLKQYSQLSGIVLRPPGENALWLNPLTRHKTPPEIAAAIQRLTFP